MPIRMSGLVSNLDTDAIVKELMSAQNTKKTKIDNKITLNEWTTEKWKDLNTKIYSLYTGSLSKMKLSGSYKTKVATSSNESKLTATGNAKATVGSNTVQIKQLASTQYLTGKVLTSVEDEQSKLTAKSKLSELGFSSFDQSITISTKKGEAVFTANEDSTIEDFVKACKDAGIEANFDENQQRIFLNSTSTGKDSAFSITCSADEDGEGSENPLQLLGLTSVEYNREDGTYTYDNSTGASIVEAKDSVVVFNGAELKGSTNSISVNGLTLELKGETAVGETLNLTVSNDTESIYKMVKDFCKDYNTLLEELNKLYDAGSARGYDPLTDEQKKEMTDDEVKKWEDKIKDSLLRRDDTLSGVLTSLKSITGMSVTVDGKAYSLGSFGIGTSVYTEKGKLHINGDSEDSLSANEKDKLKKALEEDPETVAKVLSEISSKLHDNLSDKMKSTSLSSALTIYNDKKLSKDLKQYKADLNEMEKRLKDIEDSYYAQFTRMESAMAKLNSQNNSLSSLMGVSN